MAKKALITGISGQDGSYLAELLLNKGYEVYGLVRRSANPSYTRIEHILKDIQLIYGDLSDSNSIFNALKQVVPNEFYNLAAQSHVGESFKQPQYTLDVTGKGVLRILDSIRELGLKKDCKFYQASSSEQFGKVRETPQTELTPFNARSPYGAAKIYAHNITTNYRDSYDMFNCCGILFNHETLTSDQPLMFKIGEEGLIDIKPIGEIVRNHTTVGGKGVVNPENKTYQQGAVELPLLVWDNTKWTRVTFASGYPHRPESDNKNPLIINARSGSYCASSDHVCIMEGGKEKETKDISVGDRINTSTLPNLNTESTELSIQEAELLGMLVADGYISKDNRVRLTNKNPEIRKHFKSLWKSVSKGESSYYSFSKSRFTNEIIGQENPRGITNWISKFSLYTEDRKKRIPVQILNSSPEIMLAFLRGYNAGDGLKANPCTYEFKNFKTNSPTLMLGLIYLIDKTTKQKFNLTVEEVERWTEQDIYYSLNLLSPKTRFISQQTLDVIQSKLLENIPIREISRQMKVSRKTIQSIDRGIFNLRTEHHLTKEFNEVKKIIKLTNYTGWFYDLETETGTFSAGSGLCHVHNSPRRGPEFVTRKITDGVAKIKLGMQKELRLGNLDARRDWGDARDYVEGMYLILQQQEPSDYVLATGVTRTVRDFCEIAFNYVGLNYEDYVVIDQEFYRPAEVDLLLGDCSKAKKELNWESKISFQQMVEEMVDTDLRKLKSK